MNSKKLCKKRKTVLKTIDNADETGNYMFNRDSIDFSTAMCIKISCVSSIFFKDGSISVKRPRFEKNETVIIKEVQHENISLSLLKVNLGGFCLQNKKI
jgi:hypothetical protein